MMRWVNVVGGLYLASSLGYAFWSGSPPDWIDVLAGHVVGAILVAELDRPLFNRYQALCERLIATAERAYEQLEQRQ